MKRLLSIIALAAMVAMSLVSCKSDEVKLHQAVGQIYAGNPNPEIASTMDGDGIIFHVEGDYAWICSMTDLRRDRSSASQPHLWEPDFTWSVFGTDTVMERDTIWADIVRPYNHFLGAKDSTTEYGEVLRLLNYEKRDSNVRIYPMLRYKAYTEKGEQVLPPFEKDTAFLGFIGELLPADTVIGIRRSNYRQNKERDTMWTDTTVVVRGVEYAVATGAYLTISEDTTLVRPTDSTLEWRYRTKTAVEARYSDTVWCRVRGGDVMRLGADNKGLYALDTNWSFSMIVGLGENDENGYENTQKIIHSDVPVRQKATPDSSSAARTCNQYFTRAYVESKAAYSADTAYQSAKGQWYLPSRAELRNLFNARNKINEMNANTKGFEPLANCYWSSNQRGAENAWYKCFSDNGVESYIPKANNNYRVNVRAVRKVEWPLK